MTDSNSDRELTESEQRAVSIIREYFQRYTRPMMPSEFARAMWPDSEGWSHQTKAGPYGVHQGGGMALAAGGYLGRLAKRGLVKWVSFGEFERGYILAGSPRGANAQ